MQYFEKIQEGVNAPLRAQKMLALYNHKTRSFTIGKALGDKRVRAGSLLRVNMTMGREALRNAELMVEKVTHNFEHGRHSMDLTLRVGDVEVAGGGSAAGEEDTPTATDGTPIPGITPPPPTGNPLSIALPDTIGIGENVEVSVAKHGIAIPADEVKLTSSNPARLSVQANVIFVASTNRGDSKNDNSCFGLGTVDIAAPGQNIFSTRPIPHRGDNTGYGDAALYGATSMAAPHVAGAAALLLSVNSELTTAELRTALLDNADAIPALREFVNGGRRLNVYRSLLSVLPLITTPDIAYNGRIAFGAINVSAKGSFKDRNLSVVVNKYDASNAITETASSSVHINSLELGSYQPPSTVNSLDSNEHLEISVYEDNAQQNLLARHFVHPVVFTFN